MYNCFWRINKQKTTTESGTTTYGSYRPVQTILLPLTHLIYSTNIIIVIIIIITITITIIIPITNRQ